MNVELSVVLPSYLEEENLRLLVPRIKEHCHNITDSYEILIVDTMTPMDGTPHLCEEQGIRYLNRLHGNAYGDAVRTGISQSKGEWVLFMDADGSHSPSVIEELFNQKTKYDLVIASRYVEGGFTENSKVLILMSLMVNLGYRLILGLKCKDVSNSFKLYRGSQIRSLELKCNNFDIVEEILFKLFKKFPAIRFIEIPFSFKKRMFGETKRNLFVFIFTYLVTLLKLRFS